LVKNIGKSSNSSGKFAILVKFIETHETDPKFDGGHEYLVRFEDSSTVEELSLTSDLLPEILQ
jgi:hypothetical protein